MKNIDTIEKKITSLLGNSGNLSRSFGKQEKPVLKLLRGDGSSRKFFRVFIAGKPFCIAVLPPTCEPQDMAEFRSAVEIGRHLYSGGAPVPEIMGVEEHSGLILFEDFGDIRLQDIRGAERGRAMDLYRKAVKQLAHLQVQGAKDFNRVWCYDTEVYDTEVMLNRESGYFLTAFWQDTVGGEPVDGLYQEFEDIADQVVLQSEPYFLHRDFQSRNIMVMGDRLGIIDFQAGRLGPPGYDLASLLIDPYASLTAAEQNELFSLYIDELTSFSTVDIDKLRRSYPFLAVQRNLQIIGAFSYLSAKMGKPFFKAYIMPALVMLKEKLQEDQFESYAILKNTAEQAISRFRFIDK